MTCPQCDAENLDGLDSCFHCGASFGAAGRRTVKKGTVIAGRYEVVQALGRGGMGTVYRALDRTLEETVALKLLRAEVAQSPEMARRFRSEIKLARRVTHKNVCRIHEYGVDGELNFISMEFVDGVDLKRVLRERGSLEPAFALALSIQVCDGLEAIHEVGIVHRDLKTTNVMLDPSNVVKLMDFGIAKQTGVAAEDLTGATHTGQIVGTPEYMSPEQARGDKVDPRSDVYALGIVLFELFTGDVPFRADTPIATILKHLGEPPPLRAAAGRALPEPIVPILERALAKAARDRYQSVVEMASALRAVRPEGLVAPQLEATREATARVAPAPVPRRPSPVPRTPVPAHTPTPRTPTPRTPPPLGRSRIRDTGPTLPPSAPTPAKASASASSDVLRLLPWAALAFAIVGLAGGVALYLWKPWPPSPTPAPTASPTAAPSVEPTPRPSPTAEPPSPTPRPSPTAEPPPPTPRPSSTVAPPPTPTPRPSPTVEPPSPTPTPRPSPTVEPPPPTPTPRPASTPTPSPTSRTIQWGTPAPSVSPQPAPTAVPQVAREGFLQLLVVPWAEVYVDDRNVGTTPMKPVSLPEGSYAVRFVHPDYHPLQKRVTIRHGETVKLEVDLKQEGFPKVQK